MDNFFDSLGNLQGQEESYLDEGILVNSASRYYGMFSEDDNFPVLPPKHDAEEVYLWQPEQAFQGAISYTSGYDITPERDTDVLLDCSNVINTPKSGLGPETTYLKDSLSWSSIGSSTNGDSESKFDINLQSKESCPTCGQEKQVFRLLAKLRFQLELLKSENQDLRRHMGRVSQENEILRSQLQGLCQSETMVSGTAKAGRKRRTPENDVVAIDSKNNSMSQNVSTEKTQRRKRTVKSKTLFCFSIILGFLLLPYFFQIHHSLDKDNRGIVSKNGSRPVTAIAKYVPYLDKESRGEVTEAFRSKQIVKNEPSFETSFPALRKSFDPTSEHWIRRAVEAAMHLTDPYPDDINSLLLYQKSEDFLRSYASLITHRKGSPTMLVITRDLVSILPADAIANASCPDPSSGNCDYAVSLLMPVRSFNESLSDCVYTSLECKLAHGNNNRTLSNKYL